MSELIPYERVALDFGWTIGLIKYIYIRWESKEDGCYACKELKDGR